jgi:hypothetical protein
MPIDFSLPNPSNAIIQGMGIGSAISKAQDQKAAAAQMNADLSSVFSKETPTASDYAGLVVKHPQLSKQLKTSWDMLSEEQKTNKTQQVSEVYAALASGNNDVAKSLLETQRDAAKNSGNEAAARSAQVMVDLVDKHPELARSSTAMSLATLMGPEKFTDTFTKLENDQREKMRDPAMLSKAQSDARKAAVDASFAESKAVGDLQKQGWDIYKIQEDTKIAKENSRIAAMKAQLDREKNDVAKGLLSSKLEDAKLARDNVVREKAAGLSSARGAIDNMLNTADRILATPFGVVDSAAGPVSSRMPTIIQDTSDFEALIENLDAQSFIAQIPAMKNLGSLSNEEGKKLASSLQSFSLMQSPTQLLGNVKEAQRLMMKARKILSEKNGVPDTIPDTPDAANSTAPTDIDALISKYAPGVQ